MNFKEEGIYWGGIKWNQLTKDRLDNPKCLERYGYKSYSQNDEDGIIEEIFNRIGTTNKIFVEFGVENGLESNAHLLLFKGWTGLWIEGSEESYNSLCSRFYPVIKKEQLKVIHAFITKDNINNLIGQADISGEIDMLSVDVDGNDYYIWDSIEIVSPRVVVIEYNGKLPPSVDWVMAYDENHIWDGTDWHGASLKALENLGRKKGYQLVGTGINGANAYFIKEKLAGEKFILPANAELLYNPARFGIQHIIGHPSGVCLCGQNENAGIFDYYPDKAAISQFGFEPREVWENGHSIQWISSRKSRILINNNLIKDKKKLIIKYANFRLKTIKILLNMRINGELVERDFETGISGNIELNLDKLKTGTCTTPIDIELSKLWKVSEELGGSDTRELGIAIFIDEITAV